MTRFDVQQGHHGFFGKKSRDDKNLFEQNSYLTKKIHSNFHTILHKCWDILDLQEKKWKTSYNHKNIPISAVGLHIWKHKRTFFSWNWNQLLQTGENLQHHCHLLTCVKSMSSQSITMYRDFLSLLKSGHPDTYLRIFFGQLTKIQDTITRRRRQWWRDDIVCLVYFVMIFWQLCSNPNTYAAQNKYLSRFYVWWRFSS